MTCIAGVITPHKKIVMAADSGNNDGFGAYTILKNQKKIFQTPNGMIIGVAGSSRIGQILNHDFDPPTDKHKDPFLYLLKEFVPALKEKLQEENLVDDHKMKYDSSLLIGYKGRLFRLGEDYDIVESNDNYDAIGSGRYDARGALYALKQTKTLSCEKMVKIAISAAINADVNIKPPIIIEYTK